MNFADVTCIGGALLALILPASALAGPVYVGVNRATGEVVVSGNMSDALDRLQAKTVATSAEGWGETFGSNEPGWGAVGCARLENGKYYFRVADGHQSEAYARRIAAAAVEQHLSRNEIPGKLIPDCGYAWNDADQPITLGPSAALSVAVAEASQSPSEPAAEKDAQTAGSGQLSSTPIGPLAQPILVNGDRVLVPQSQPGVPTSESPKRDYESEYQAKLALWEQQRTEFRRKVEEHEEAKRQVEATKTLQREQAQGVLSDYKRQLAEHAATVAAFAEEHRRWQIASQQQVPGSPDASGQGTGIADAFKVQNDAEWKKVSEGLPLPRDFPGHPYAYCYQPSLVDSVMYEAAITPTQKSKTELELEFADVVAKITRISSAMSTHCHVTNDVTYLMRLRDNVRRVHADMRIDPPLLIPR